MPPKTLQIRNSNTEFLIFIKQTGENGKSGDNRIEVHVQGRNNLAQPKTHSCHV
jgi:hypothetical protein